MSLLLTIAQAAPAAAPKGSPLQFPIMMALLFGVMYFMMIRPQRRREKERKAMIAAVKKGDQVLMTSGIMGQITAVKENSLMVRISENTKIEVVTGAISQVFEKGDEPTEIAATK